jgi:hypothetical protein
LLTQQGKNWYGNFLRFFFMEKQSQLSIYEVEKGKIEYFKNIMTIMVSTSWFRMVALQFEIRFKW